MKSKETEFNNTPRLLRRNNTVRLALPEIQLKDTGKQTLSNNFVHQLTKVQAKHIRELSSCAALTHE
jgi:hypothetical protein